MIRYAVVPKPGHPSVSMAGAIYCAPESLAKVVDDCTNGRGDVLAIPSVARKLRQSGSVYIAGRKSAGVIVVRSDLAGMMGQ